MIHQKKSPWNSRKTFVGSIPVSTLLMGLLLDVYADAGRTSRIRETVLNDPLPNPKKY